MQPSIKPCFIQQSFRKHKKRGLLLWKQAALFTYTVNRSEGVYLKTNPLPPKPLGPEAGLIWPPAGSVKVEPKTIAP